MTGHNFSGLNDKATPTHFRLLSHYFQNVLEYRNGSKLVVASFSRGSLEREIRP